MFELMKSFPVLKLHKEVHDRNINYKKCGVFMAIPKGNKYFIWFTRYRGEPTCILINKKTRKTEKIFCSFNISLSLGTILYGTKIMYNNKAFFSFEDIYYYKGKELHSNFSTNMEYIRNVLSSIHNLRDFIVFGFPVYNDNFTNLINKIRNIYYPIYSIQYRDLKKHGSYMVRIIKETENEKEKTAVFIIKPDIQNDIYKLYCNDNIFYSYADIPNIKTSMLVHLVMLQHLAFLVTKLLPRGRVVCLLLIISL